MTTRSGSSVLTSCAIAEPSANPALRTTSLASGCPVPASAITLRASPGWLTRRPSAGPDEKSSSARLLESIPSIAGNTPRALAKVPVNPRAPRYGWPFVTRQQLIPVPTVTNKNISEPAPAPNFASARAAARTSASTRVGKIDDRRPRTGMFSQSIVALLTIFPSRLTSSATPTPIAVALPRTVCASEITSWRTASPPRIASVAFSRRSTTAPLSKSTNPAAIFVPPTSMPTARGMLRLQPVGERANVSGVASAAAADVTDAFIARGFRKCNKFGARQLNAFKRVRKLRQARKRLNFAGRLKSGRLRRDRNVRRFAHFAKQRKHHCRALLAIRADRDRAQISHDARAFGRRVAVAAFFYGRSETHRRDRP